VDDLKIVFESEDLLILSKKSGILVHRGYANDPITYVDLVREHGFVPRPLHRLDRQTSGILMFAKTKIAASEIGRLFEEKKIHKTYIALVRGIPPIEGEIDHPIPKAEKAERVPAHSTFERIASVDIQPRSLSLVKVFPTTGKFHQVRRHMKHIHHPLIGDANYGKGKLNREIRERYGLNRLALHALSVSFDWRERSYTFQENLPESLTLPFHKMGFDLDDPSIT